jgi:hypothetical protein
MKKLGDRLLYTASLARHLKNFPPKVADASRGIVLYQPDLTFDELRKQLQDMFCLEPLGLGELQTISVEVRSRRVVRDGQVGTAYLAEARVPYWGSRTLWPVRPAKGLNFPYTGMPAVASVGLRTLIPSKDVRPFEEEVQQVLARTRAALAEFAPVVRSYDAAIRVLIDTAVRSWR